MPALLQDAFRGVSPAVLSTWPGGVGALNVPIPLRGGGAINPLMEGIPTGKVSGMRAKYNKTHPLHAQINGITSTQESNQWGGARKHRRRPTRKASRKVQRKSRRLTRRR